MKTAKAICNVVYALGAAATLALVALALFGSNQASDPDAMLPVSQREQGFIALAIGALPMLLAGMAVYKCNDIKNSTRQKRNLLLVFLPVFVCCGCALYWLGVVLFGFANTFLFS